MIMFWCDVQNPTDEEVFGLLAQVDTDGSGNIDFQEFLQVWICC
jgi:Ca2+-binding EF-hand superfamily protein